MATFKMYRGLKVNLPTAISTPPIADGALYFCTDTLEIYEGYMKDQDTPALRRYGGIMSVDYASTSSQGYTSGKTTLQQATAATKGMVCYVISENLLVASDGSNWIVLNPGQFTGATASAAGTLGLVPAPSAGETTKFLKSDGTWATINGDEVKLTGYTTPLGGSVASTDTILAAIFSLDSRMSSLVAGGGEPNQNAFSSIKVEAQNTSDTPMEGHTGADASISASASTDNITVGSGDKWITVEADVENKKVKFGHKAVAASTGAFGPSTSVTLNNGGNFVIPKINVDAAGHISSVEEKTMTLPSQTNYGLTVTTSTGSTGDQYAKRYTFSQNSTQVAEIDIPKDMVVSSGEVVDVEANTIEYGGGYLTAGKYIKLILANATSDVLYISASSLIDVYTALGNASQVQLAVTNNVISATIVSGSIGSTELAVNCVTNAKLAKMPSGTVKGNNTNNEADPTDITIGDLLLYGFLNDNTTGDITANDTITSAINKLKNNLIANARLNSMPAKTVKANTASNSAAPTDTFLSKIPMGDFTHDSTKTGTIYSADTLEIAINKLFNRVADYIAKSSFTAAGDILVGTGNGEYKKLTKGSANQVLKMNASGTDLEWNVDNDTDTHYASSTIVNGSANSSDIQNSDSAVTNGNVYLKHVENGVAVSTHKVVGNAGIEVTSNSNADIVVSSVWGTF